jgi:hypothetical protein
VFLVFRTLKCLYQLVDRSLSRDPLSILKSDLTKRDFDIALDELADQLWNDDREPFFKAYARAMNSEAGNLLYQAREWAASAPPVEPIRKAQPVTKAEETITSKVAEYRAAHPRVSGEKALVEVLNREPQLCTDYLRNWK